MVCRLYQVEKRASRDLIDGEVGVGVEKNGRVLECFRVLERGGR